MPVQVVFSEDPTWVLGTAEAFLASEPCLHNLVLTLLRALGAAADEPQRVPIDLW
jgi:hypothetical protein